MEAKSLCSNCLLGGGNLGCELYSYSCGYRSCNRVIPCKWRSRWCLEKGLFSLQGSGQAYTHRQPGCSVLQESGRPLKTRAALEHCFTGSLGLGLVKCHPAYKALLAFVVSIQVNNAFFYEQYLSAFNYVFF